MFYTSGNNLMVGKVAEEDEGGITSLLAEKNILLEDIIIKVLDGDAGARKYSPKGSFCSKFHLFMLNSN